MADTTRDEVEVVIDEIVRRVVVEVTENLGPSVTHGVADRLDAPERWERWVSFMQQACGGSLGMGLDLLDIHRVRHALREADRVLARSEDAIVTAAVQGLEVVPPSD